MNISLLIDIVLSSVFGFSITALVVCALLHHFISYCTPVELLDHILLNQPSTWQQLCAFSHPDVGKITYRSLTGTSEWRRNCIKGFLNVVRLLVPHGLVSQKYFRNSSDFNSSLWILQGIVQKHQFRDICVGQKVP